MEKEDIHYERAGFKGYHLLKLNDSLTGVLLEIAITFSSGVCNKTNVTQYHGKTVVWSFLCATLTSFSHWPVEGVLTSVSVSSTTQAMPTMTTEPGSMSLHIMHVDMASV